MQWRYPLAVAALAATVALGSPGPAARAADDEVQDAQQDAQVQAVIERLEKRVLELEGRLAEQEAALEDVHRVEGEIVTMPEDSAWQDVGAAKRSSLQWSGHVDFGYTKNLNNPRGPRPGEGQNNLRVFDRYDETFELNALQLTGEVPAVEPGDVGARFDLLFGTQADQVASTGFGADLGSDPSGGNVLPDSVDVLQAFGTYRMPHGRDAIDLVFGKFVTWIGLEVVETHLNPNISRSFLFGYAIPFAHTGVGASYQFTDEWYYAHYLVNGWDDALNENDSFSTGGQLGWTPAAEKTFGHPTSVYLNYILGEEGSPEGGDARYVIDLVATTQLNDMWEAMLNVDVGGEDNAGPNGEDGDWWGVAGILVYHHTDNLNFALRGEYFEDDDSVRTGFTSLNPMLMGPVDAELWEITLTANWWVTENLLLRAEYRHDEANEDVFLGDGATEFEDSQDTVAFRGTVLF